MKVFNLTLSLIAVVVVLFASWSYAQSKSDSAPNSSLVDNNTPKTEKTILSVPKGKILLTIYGAIDNTNVDNKAIFDRDMLLSFETHTLKTSTSWTDGVQEFEGVLASDIMNAVGAKGTIITATALNDYVVDIPIEDFAKYGVLFALKMNGKKLTRRNKGPIWPIYPRDSFPELQDRAADKKWIYMLYKMEVK